MHRTSLISEYLITLSHTSIWGILSVSHDTAFIINIYLALKTSRNNAVVDLSESKNSEKRVIKEADF